MPNLPEGLIFEVADAAGIQGRSARAEMERLKKTAMAESNKHLLGAQQALQDLHRLLQQSADLNHVSKCFKAMADLAHRNTGLEAKTLDVHAASAAYERTANTLLAGITIDNTD